MNQTTSSPEENYSSSEVKMKYFLFNHVGSLNHGCEAIIRGTVNIIENADKNSEFVLSSFNPESDKGIEDVEAKQFSTRELTKAEYLMSAINIRLNHSEKYALKKMYAPVVEQAADCDICLSVGGDTYCYGDNSGIQTLTEELKASGKKVVLWGVSIGEEDLTDDKLENLRIFDAIFAREPITYELLKRKEANSSIYLNADPAFCMEREDLPVIDGFTKDNTLGLNVSPLIEKGNSKISEIIFQFIDYVLENTTLNILLIPHVLEKDNNDYAYMTRFADKFEETNRVKMLPDTLNAKQYKGYIARTRFFVGARTHATIAAYSNGVPTVVLGYSVKSRGIAKDLFGEEKYVVNSKELTDSSELIDEFNSLIDNEPEIKETLKKIIPFKIKSAMQLGEELFKL